MPDLPMIAVVGRPNVGKSSLVNRVLGRREAIVQETPGVTRDRRSFVAEWRGRRFEIVDTGGLEPGAEGLDARVAEQANVAMAAADLILLVVDAQTGPTQDDLEVASALRRATAPVLVVVNKVDRPKEGPAAIAEFYGLGLGEPVPVSALHGTASGDLLDTIVDRLPETEEGGPDAWASIAIVGRPNVGKSSILNGLVRHPRSIVDATPGTTRDPVDSYIPLDDGRELRLVDTAGMRREVQIKDPIEYFSFLRSRGTLGRVDAALLVIDAAEGVTGHDQRIANEIVEAGRACVVALNKWDLMIDEEVERGRRERSMDEALRFLPWATMVRTSALTQRGIGRLVPSLVAAVEAHRTRLPTASLNRFLRDAQQARPHPRSAGRSLRVLYGVQASVGPPTIVLFTNGRLERDYLRYLENRLREFSAFPGTPVRFQVRVKTRPQV
ncbi:MAG TPA: ribosome biogenesis GTPase Der [Actinomycetota bacterium]|nr:ribosome biogenesis GTPase Der [Actinomycetota bacterium]